MFSEISRIHPFRPPAAKKQPGRTQRNLPEAIPATPEIIPGMWEMVPETPDGVPGIREVIPGLPEMVPETPEAVPGTGEVIPGRENFQNGGIFLKKKGKISKQREF